MADLAHGVQASARSKVVRLADPEEVLRLLREDRLASAYVLGDVDRHGRPRGEWFLSPSPPAIAGFQRLSYGAAVYAAGSPAGFAAIIEQTARPGELYFSGPQELLDAIRPRYSLVSADQMIRMALTAAQFRPMGTADRLTAGEADQVNRLYRLGAGGQITRQQIAEGVYFGAREDGRLVAVAGTHFINARERLAAVGNVFTHPAYRGRGHATRVTSAVAMALLDRCRDIILNVSATNAPAQAAYRRLGFSEYSRFVEAFSTRRSSGIWGMLGRWLRRQA